MIDGTGWKVCRMSASLRRENAPYRGSGLEQAEA